MEAVSRRCAGVQQHLAGSKTSATAASTPSRLQEGIRRLSDTRRARIGEGFVKIGEESKLVSSHL